MGAVVIYEGGKAHRNSIRRMYFANGPHLLGTRRLDHLVSATVIRDASTVSTSAMTDGTATTSMGSQAARGVAGAVLAGPVGAIIGGSGAKQNIATKTITQQTMNTDVYMQLQFKGESGPLTVQAKDEEAFQIIQSYAGSSEWTQAELDEAKVRGERAKSRADKLAVTGMADAEILGRAQSHAAIVVFLGLIAAAIFPRILLGSRDFGIVIFFSFLLLYLPIALILWIVIRDLSVWYQKH
jgi:hypothetical protein